MRTRKIVPALALAAMLLCMPLASCSQTGERQSVTETDCYTLYVGTTGQTAHEPVMDVDEAKDLLGSLALDYCGGYTIYEATGGWKDEETGYVYREDTLVVVLSGASYDQAMGLARDAAQALDQESILIEHDALETEYFTSDTE